KKRYNLKRQVRVLRGHCGGRLELHRFESPHQLDDLFGAVDGPVSSVGLSGWGESGPLAARRHGAGSLARRRLAPVYLLTCAGRPCAALEGLQYRGVYHVDGIPRDRRLDRFSPGSTAFHMVIEDLIRDTVIAKVDLGFGEPVYPHSSLNVVEPRAS